MYYRYLVVDTVCIAAVILGIASACLISCTTSPRDNAIPSGEPQKVTNPGKVQLYSESPFPVAAPVKGEVSPERLPVSSIPLPEWAKLAVIYGGDTYMKPDIAAQWRLAESQSKEPAPNNPPDLDAPLYDGNNARVYFRELDKKYGKAPANKGSVGNLYLNGGDSILASNLLPDGSILFQIGWIDRYGTYKFYLLDSKRKKLIPRGVGGASYPKVKISPDGEWVLYVDDTDITGREYKPTPPRLRALNLKTNQQYTVVYGWGLAAGGWTWIDNETFLYAHLDKQSKGKLRRPNLYKFNVKNKRKRLILENAWGPVVSPSRKKIAFFGAEDKQKTGALPEHWDISSDGTALCVSSIAGSSRRTINREAGAYPQIFWRGENRLVALKPGEIENVTIGKLDEYSLADGTLRPIVDLPARDALDTVGKPLHSITFPKAKICADGVTMILESQGYTRDDAPDKTELLITNTLTALNLDSGQRRHIFKAQSVHGLGWEDFGTSFKGQK